MSNSINPAKSGNSRVFLLEGGARADRKPSFEAFMKAGGLEWGVGDVTKIEGPDPSSYGDFITIGEVQGQIDRPKLTLTGRYALDVASKMLEMATRRCPVDVHVHMGQCTDPTSFQDFTKALVLEDAKPVNYTTDDLGALASDDNKNVDENLDVTGRKAYEILPLSVTEKAGDVITNEILKVLICDTKSCGDCADESDGSEKLYAITKAAGGSPTTPPDMVYSLDKGLTWVASDIDSLSSSQDPSSLGCVGAYMVVVSASANNLNYVLKSELNATGDETWVGVTTGFVTGKQPRAMDVAGGVAFIAGNGGYIYRTLDPTAGVEVLSAGVLTSDDLLDVHALSDTFIVISGNNGTVLVSSDGVNFEAIAKFVGIGIHFNAIWAKSKLEWLVGASNGKLYVTKDGGLTWAEKGFPGSGSGVVYDISFATRNVGYLAHTTTAPKGRILRTYDGGYSWSVTPELLGSAGIPSNQRLNSVAANLHDVNFYVAGGLGVSTDGIILTAQD